MQNDLVPSIALIAKGLDEELKSQIQSQIPSLEFFDTNSNSRSKLLQKIKESIINQSKLSKKEFDLIIKFGEEKSLSNTLILEAAYSEIYFSSQKPSLEEIFKAIEEFKSRKRNFGA